MLREGEDEIEIGELGRRIADAAVADATDFKSPMECEHYASHLADIWEGRAVHVLGPDTAAAIGYGVSAALARSKKRAIAAQLLAGIAAVSDEPVGEIAASFLAELDPKPTELPPWFNSVGNARAVRAGRVADPTTDDGAIVLIDVMWPCGERGGVSAFIDDELGGIAKHFLVGPPIDVCRAEIEAEEGRHWPFEVLSPGDAAALVGEAIARTEEAGPDPPVGLTYRSQRAFVRAQLARIGETFGRPQAA